MGGRIVYRSVYVTKKSGEIDSCNLKESPLSESRYFPNVFMDKLKYRYIELQNQGIK